MSSDNDDRPRLHIYGPSCPNSKASIYGNRAGMVALHEALGELLSGACDLPDGTAYTWLLAYYTDDQERSSKVLLEMAEEEDTTSPAHQPYWESVGAHAELVLANERTRLYDEDDQTAVAIVSAARARDGGPTYAWKRLAALGQQLEALRERVRTLEYRCPDCGREMGEGERLGGCCWSCIEQARGEKDDR